MSGLRVMLRSGGYPDVQISADTWEACDETQLEQHIRTLQAALKWLREEKKRKEKVAAK